MRPFHIDVRQRGNERRVQLVDHKLVSLPFRQVELHVLIRIPFEYLLLLHGTEMTSLSIGVSFASSISLSFGGRLAAVSLIAATYDSSEICTTNSPFQLRFGKCPFFLRLFVVQILR